MFADIRFVNILLSISHQLREKILTQEKFGVSDDTPNQQPHWFQLVYFLNFLISFSLSFNRYA